MESSAAEPWHGENPFYLIILHDAAVPKRIDLDESGWLAKLKDDIDAPGEWHLVTKLTDKVILSLRVEEGDQPYYVGRHIGFAGASSNSEVIAYGIGKKSQRFRKGTWQFNEDNLWVLPWGQICGGADVEYFALKGLRTSLR